MNISTILEFLKANHVDFNKDFERVENESFISEYSETVNSAVNKLTKYVKFGINNGFSEDLNQGIKETTDLIVKISKEKNTKNYAKINDSLSRIESDLSKKTMKKDNSTGDNVLSKMLVYVNKYSLAISALQKTKDAVRPAVLEELSDKLDDLKEQLNDAVDVTSTNALEHAKNILSLLNQMRDAVSNNIHDERTYTLLDKAIEEANAWANERVGVVIKKSLFKTKSNIATDTSVLNYKQNSLTTILEGQDAYKTLSLIRENINNYKSIIDKRFSFAEEQAEMDATQSEIDKANLEITNLLKKYQNGEIAPAIFTAMVKAKQSEIKNLNEQLLQKQQVVKEKVSRHNLNYKVYYKLNNTIRVIENFSDEPAVLNYLVSQINVSSLTRVMNGTGNEQDIASILNIKFVTDSVNAKTQERLKNFINSMEEQEEYLARTLTETEEEEETISNENAEKEEADRLVAQLLGKQPLTVQKPTNEPLNTTQEPLHDIKDEN